MGRRQGQLSRRSLTLSLQAAVMLTAVLCQASLQQRSAWFEHVSRDNVFLLCARYLATVLQQQPMQRAQSNPQSGGSWVGWRDWLVRESFEDSLEPVGVMG